MNLLDIPNIIIVAIDTHGKRSRDFGIDNAKAFDGGNTAGQASRFLFFLTKELMPKVKVRFRTSGTNMLPGHSMGGLFTIYSFIANPDVFDGYFAFSPSFNEALGTANALESRLQNGSHANKFAYLNLGLEMFNGYRETFAEVDIALQNHNKSDLRYQVSYYALPHSLIMVAGYIEALTAFYEQNDK